MDRVLWAEYPKSQPFDSSAERFWPQVLPEGKHRATAHHTRGDDQIPGPGSYSEHEPMGKRVLSAGTGQRWRPGNDDLCAFLKLAAADDHLPAFWAERFFKVRRESLAWHRQMFFLRPSSHAASLLIDNTQATILTDNALLL